ncbi:MAG TPA: hypothetical protein PLQ76_03980, partial [bacterium]|nr:hypothetical protein [bacterium]
RLLKISKEDKSIKLSPVVSEADVLAALGFLGYEVYVTEADLAKLKKLVDSGIAPVVKMPLELRGGYEDIASKSRRKFDFSDFYYWRGNGDEPFTYGVVAGYDDSRGVIIMYDFRKAQPRSKKPLTEGEIKEIVYHRTGRDLIKDVNERRRELKGEVVREYAYPYFDEKWSEKGRNAIIILGERESPGALKKAGIAAADIESGTAAESLISRGDFYYREKDFFRALKLYQQAISVRDSKYAERMTALCAMRLSPKRPKKEWTRELDAYRGESEYVAWLADPENARAAREYSTAFIRDFERDRLDAAMLVKYGDMLYPANASERPKLKKIYKRLAAYDPGDTEPINNLIKMYMDEKDYRSALPLLSKAIKLSADAGYTEVDEEISMNRVRRALCLVELGGLKRAAEETEKIDPGDFYGEPDFRYVRGRLLMSKGKLKAARREFEKALSLKSGDAKSRLYLAKALLGLGDKKLAGLEAGIVIDMELSGPLLKEARRIARIAGRKSG